jgi:hypothetical protein
LRRKNIYLIWVVIMMDFIKSIKLEEDMFPKTFTDFVEKDFEILFYNQQNKISHDSNHAVIYKSRRKQSCCNYIFSYFRI